MRYSAARPARHQVARERNYTQNYGVPGVVYILRNAAFKENWIKIGCTRYSGSKRAQDLNREASTGIPAHHVCVFEIKTLDCGRAERRVHEQLQQFRKGRQEFFEIDIEIAKKCIFEECRKVDEIIKTRSKQLNISELKTIQETEFKEINTEKSTPQFTPQINDLHEQEAQKNNENETCNSRENLRRRDKKFEYTLLFLMVFLPFVLFGEAGFLGFTMPFVVLYVFNFDMLWGIVLLFVVGIVCGNIL